MIIMVIPHGEGPENQHAATCLAGGQRLLGGPQVLHKPQDMYVISRWIYSGRPKGVWKQFTADFLKPHVIS